MKEKIYLAVDLGAESGRVMAGLWNGKRLRLEEVHRFPNGGVWLGETLRWDVVRLWNEIQNGLSLAARKFGRRIVSIGADTWGVDFVLLNAQDELLGLPYHYRDQRTAGSLERLFKRVPRSQVFAQSGLQFMEINSLCQLLAWQERSPELLKAARTLLFMPDFIHWALCGEKRAEFTIASTSQFLHPVTRDWSRPLLKKLGLPAHFLPEVVMPGTVLGKIRASLAERTGLAGVKVVTPPSHDTASAVVGTPSHNTGKANWAYISSGTWSLMGVEVKQAVMTPEALGANMTNEGGIDGTYRLLKNIMGLWLVQQCRRAFQARGHTYDYADLTTLARKAKSTGAVVNPDDPSFVNPPDMPKALQQYCRRTRQRVPRTEGELVRCAFESLALKYRDVLAKLEALSGERTEVIHIVGGGSQNQFLNQLAANACQRPVLAGPVEATAMGNLLTQIRADGELKSLAEMREVVCASSEVRRFEPQA